MRLPPKQPTARRASAGIGLCPIAACHSTCDAKAPPQTRAGDGRKRVELKFLLSSSSLYFSPKPHQFSNFYPIKTYFLPQLQFALIRLPGYLNAVFGRQKPRI